MMQYQEEVVLLSGRMQVDAGCGKSVGYVGEERGKAGCLWL